MSLRTAEYPSQNTLKCLPFLSCSRTGIIKARQVHIVRMTKIEVEGLTNVVYLGDYNLKQRETDRIELRTNWPEVKPV